MGNNGERNGGGAELLAPAGDFGTALAAFDAGADAVYCGLADFSARAFAQNFTFEELENLLRVARAGNRRVYVTFNTLLDEAQLDGAVATLARLEDLAPDGLIVQDLGVARLCRRHFPGLALHASTQLVAHNLEGVLALRDLGFRRVVLARELSLEEIASVARRCGDVELECFIHGALCYSLSGLCLFGAMEKGRSGNRGRCPYCCRGAYADASGGRTLAFSMKDLRLGPEARKLVEAGVASLKIEGRMKSPLYVASVTRYYRDLLDGTAGPESVTTADLETVFSRRTTSLYLNGRPREAVIDADSLGHVGTPVGSVKRVTKDRDGRSWVRFHTARALEKHDGLQFDATVDGKHVGLGVDEMRTALSRHPVFEVAAGTDVEIAVGPDLAAALRPGMKVFCSMSNAVKRRFPAVSFRPGDYPGLRPVDLVVALAADGIRATAGDVTVRAAVALEPAKHPDRTFAAVEKAFSKLGETGYRLGRLAVDDPERRFAPPSVLNDVRRDLVERLEAVRTERRARKVEAARADPGFAPPPQPPAPRRSVRLRPDQQVPAGRWDEVVVAISPTACDVSAFDRANLRLGLPVYTPEPSFNRLRTTVKRLVREGFGRWEASDLATLRMLRALGVTDITADWTLYAFNAQALATVADLGVRAVVASPENTRENLQYLSESGADVSLLAQQSTPLFLSLTEPKPQAEFAVYARDGLWVTTRPVPRTFATPAGASTRIDLSWDPA